VSQEVATRDAYGDALAKLGEVRQDLVVLDGDLSGSTKTGVFGKKFPDRFFDLGIAEQNIMCAAAGFAMSGKLPFVSTFAVFAPGRCFDQIRLQVAYNNLNVKIVTTHAGITTGEDGASAQALEDVAAVRAVANMTVIVPADGPETEAAVFAAAEHQGPVYMRLGRAKVPVIYKDGCDFKIGRANCLRDGKDATIIACGVMVAEALEAADKLSSRGIEARVLDMATVKPADTEAIARAAEETGAIVTAEEHNILGGLGSAVAEVVGETKPVPMQRVGIRDVFGRSGSPRELMERYGLTSKDIAAAVEKVIGRKSQLMRR
jgi:transketolase